MKPTQVFGIVVRSIGLFVVVASMGFLIPGMLSLVMGGPMTGLLFYGVPTFIIGLWLLRGPRIIISLAYPGEKED
jgi:hypothetical protein